jgi:hypothetical protein
MAERRPLSEGITQGATRVDPAIEREMVFGKPEPMPSKLTSAQPITYAAPPPTKAVLNQPRVHFSTKLRGDYVDLLKRISLERRLNQVEPNTLIDILEQAIEPWLRANGYLK